MASKIIISPKTSGFRQKRVLRDLNIHLRSKGIRTEIGEAPHQKGSLGNGVIRGITAILTGGEGFFTKLGEAVVQYVVNKKTELSIKNDRGQEIALNSTMSHDQIHSIINNFLSSGGSRIIPNNDENKKPEEKADQDEKPKRKRRIPAKKPKKVTNKKKAKPKTAKTPSSTKLKKKESTAKKRKPVTRKKKKVSK